MKRLLMITAFCMIAVPAFACPPCGPGEEPPTNEPEPEPPTSTPPTMDHGSDRDKLPSSVMLPCCIQEGKLVAKKQLFRRLEKTMEFCRRKMEESSPYIYECDIGGEEALK